MQTAKQDNHRFGLTFILTSSVEFPDTSWTSEGLIKVPSSSTTSRPAFNSLKSGPGGTPSATHLS